MNGFTGKESEMNRHEIEQAITKLSPEELARFRQWFEKFYIKARNKQFEGGKTVKLAITRLELEQHLDELRGSLKGKGLLKALMADKDLEKRL
jgi:hypothetical protein